jgi:hypothetical protein
MVAPTADAASPPDDPQHHPRARGGVRRLASSAVRLASIQVKIWLTQVKSTALKIGLFVGLFLAAAVLALLAIIFLYIGVFHLLTEVIGMRHVWAYLIFGGVHLVLAAVLALVAMKILTKKDEDDDDEDDDHDHPDHKHHAPHATASGKEPS